MGDRAADALMGYLPPVGWADVATKRDLDVLERRFDALPQIFATKADLTDQTRTLLVSYTALNLTFGALILGVVQVLR